jgi:hypothetical protein
MPAQRQRASRPVPGRLTQAGRPDLEPYLDRAWDEYLAVDPTRAAEVALSARLRPRSPPAGRPPGVDRRQPRDGRRAPGRHVRHRGGRAARRRHRPDDDHRGARLVVRARAQAEPAPVEAPPAPEPAPVVAPTPAPEPAAEAPVVAPTPAPEPAAEPAPVPTRPARSPPRLRMPAPAVEPAPDRSCAGRVAAQGRAPCRPTRHDGARTGSGSPSGGDAGRRAPRASTDAHGRQAPTGVPVAPRAPRTLDSGRLADLVAARQAARRRAVDPDASGAAPGSGSAPARASRRSARPPRPTRRTVTRRLRSRAGARPPGCRRPRSSVPSPSWLRPPRSP